MRSARLDALDVLQHGLAEVPDRLRHQGRPLVLRSEHDGLGQALGNPGDHVAEVDVVLALDALAHQFVNVAVQAIAHPNTPRFCRVGTARSLSSGRASRGPVGAFARPTNNYAPTCLPTNAIMRPNMSPVAVRSGEWPECRSMSIGSNAISPPAFL